jgi:hypothetical protein
MSLIILKFLLGFIENFMMVIIFLRWKRRRVISMRGQAVRTPYSQMVIGLDQLMFGGKIENEQQAMERADTIEAYLEATGWTWDAILELSSEGTHNVCN